MYIDDVCCISHLHLAGVLLLRCVPESRLHVLAAEANFSRASQGQSVLALRHAALALELLKNVPPPEKRLGGGRGMDFVGLFTGVSLFFNFFSF